MLRLIKEKNSACFYFQILVVTADREINCFANIVIILGLFFFSPNPC